MAPEPSNLIDELSRAAAQSQAVAEPLVDRSAWLIAGLWSLVIHAAITFNAAVWQFHFPETVQAKLEFAKGESAQAVEVQLTMMAPPTKPTPVKPQELPPETPTPPTPPVPPVDETIPPPEPVPFEQTPPPAREPVDGAAPGRSPLANRVLKDDAAAVSEPEPIEAQQQVERGIGAPPADALKPVEQPREKSANSSPSLATNQVKTTTTPAQAAPMPVPMPLDVTLAALPPTIEFTPPTLTPPAPATPPVSRAATAGVSRGAEADLVKPRYPALSIRAGEEGTIILEIEVLPDGSVGFVRVIESPGYDRLEKAAIDAVRKSKFSPAQRDGSPIREVVRKTIRFRLQDA